MTDTISKTVSNDGRRTTERMREGLERIVARVVPRKPAAASGRNVIEFKRRIAK